jgi:acetyl esterase/lipase
MRRAILALAIATVAVGACTAPEERKDVAYDARLGDDGQMDVYLPDGDAPRNPAVLFIHGGSWTGGDKDHFRAAGRRLARSGYVVASTNYRLVPGGRFPRNIQDCLCSLAYLRAHAAEHRIDPDRIVVMGYSAGAHLAGLVGLASANAEIAPDCDEARGTKLAPPAGVIAACGPQDMRTFWREAGDRRDIERIFGGSPERIPHAYELGSPRWHVRAGAPPFLLLGDAYDFGGIEDMRGALAAAGNDVRLLKLAGSLHVLEQHADPGAYEVGMASETPEAWIAIEDFLARTIGQGGGPR